MCKILKMKTDLVLNLLNALPRGGVSSYLLAMCVVLLALLLRLAIAPPEAGLPFLTFFPAVTLVAVLGGFRAGALALSAGSLLATYFFIAPFGTWTYSFNAEALWSNLIYAVEETIVMLVIEAMYRQRSNYVAAAGLLEQIRQSKQELQISAVALETREAVMITDASGVILRVNQAVTEMTGYSAEEIVGQTPRLFRSGHHDAAFYAAMWEHLLQQGLWQGEIWDKRKDGEIRPVWMTITAVKGADGVTTNYVSTQVDITDRKAAEDEIRNLAFYDTLTRLPNRRLLQDRLYQALVAGNRNRKQGALLFIDLDHFKMLNDTLGHDKGDMLLQQMAQRLLLAVREGDTVARLGGDEFVVMLEELSPDMTEAAAQAKAVAEKIMLAINHVYLLSGSEYYSTPSIGVTLFGNTAQSLEDLLKQADLAMYQAKAAGRNTLRFFDPEMQVALNRRACLEADLRNAIREGKFILHYQAQVEGKRGLTGAEALLRWQHPQRGMVPAEQFIALAEETGLIVPLGLWVLETACGTLANWGEQPATAALSLALNVSVQQMRQPDFVEQVLTVLERSGADPCRLKLEITEGLLMENMPDTIAKMSALQARGVGFALDDFGTGYSSLTYLKRLPLEKLKIDRSFVMDVLTDQNAAAIARSVVALAHSLGLSVLAEGVESEAQCEFLALHGCHAYQGYLFGKPLPLEAFASLVQHAPALCATL
ncbi:MAG: EAL domain-containing protein [Burkholderiales bacterium]|nr:EAL domain-containing protein [Burkholderiales bacterium]